VNEEPEMVTVAKDDWDSVRGDKCLLEDRVQKLRNALRTVADWSSSRDVRQYALEVLYDD
jgi:hypothetical protein